jgi:hypothetical protein
MKSEVPELAALIATARHGDEPTEHDRERVMGRVAQRLAIGVGASAALFATSRLGWANAAKALSVAAFVGAGVTSGYMVNERQAPVPAVVSVPAERAATAAAPAESAALDASPAEPSEQAAPAPIESPKAAEPVRAEAPKRAPAEAPAIEPSRLAKETAALRAANDALRGGNAAQALTLLDGFNTEFPRAVLGQEATATRVAALCALDRVAEARQIGSRFLQRYPRSPVAARVRSSCAAR